MTQTLANYGANMVIAARTVADCENIEIEAKGRKA